MQDEVRKRGRPPKDVSKDCRVGFRVDDNTQEMFDFICEKKGKTKTEMFEYMVRTQYNLAKYAPEIELEE